MLYLVATPIGNFEDLSPRAQRILGEAETILVEKKSDSIKLFARFGIKPKRIIPYDENNHNRTIKGILSLLEKEDVAMITSAGMPGVSDPGARLIKEVKNAGIAFRVVPGPSALPVVIAAGGFPGPYLFVGFLPKKSAQINSFFERKKTSEETIVFFESGIRILKTLEILAQDTGWNVSISKEISKIHETHLQDKAAELLEVFKKAPSLQKGEFACLTRYER